MIPKENNLSIGLQIKNFSSNKWCWGTWIATFKGVTLDPFLTSFTKINSKWTKDVHEELQLLNS